MTDAATRLAEVRDQIARAATAAQRNAGDVTLVAVSKRHNVAAIEDLIARGVTDFGENRFAEAAERVVEIANGRS